MIVNRTHFAWLDYTDIILFYNINRLVCRDGDLAGQQIVEPDTGAGAHVSAAAR
jgi:hypothetical protein